MSRRSRARAEPQEHQTLVARHLPVDDPGDHRQLVEQARAAGCRGSRSRCPVCSRRCVAFRRSNMSPGQRLADGPRVLARGRDAAEDRLRVLGVADHDPHQLGGRERRSPSRRRASATAARASPRPRPPDRGGCPRRAAGGARRAAGWSPRRARRSGRSRTSPPRSGSASTTPTRTRPARRSAPPTGAAAAAPPAGASARSAPSAGRRAARGLDRRPPLRGRERRARRTRPPARAPAAAAARPRRRSSTQVSLDPPPWLEFTTRLPLDEGDPGQPAGQHPDLLAVVDRERAQVQVPRREPAALDHRGAGRQRDDRLGDPAARVGLDVGRSRRPAPRRWPASRRRSRSRRSRPPA